MPKVQGLAPVEMKDPLGKNPAAPVAVAKTPRWEFVLLFLWKEPLPGLEEAK